MPKPETYPSRPDDNTGLLIAQLLQRRRVERVLAGLERGDPRLAQLNILWQSVMTWCPRDIKLEICDRALEITSKSSAQTAAVVDTPSSGARATARSQAGSTATAAPAKLPSQQILFQLSLSEPNDPIAGRTVVMTKVGLIVCRATNAFIASV
jgi:hypothetical protein